jgi:hypothetical protein
MTVRRTATGSATIASVRFSIPGRPTVAGEGWVHAEGDPLPHPVSIRVKQDADGRLVATGLLIEADRELTARDLRFPLASVIADLAASKPHARKKLAREYFANFGIELVFEGSESESPTVTSWRWLAPVSGRVPRRTRPGPRGHDHAFYRDIADAYKRAQREHPQRPIQTLMDDFGYSEAQIHRHLRGARERELLPPTTRGRATPARKGK